MSRGLGDVYKRQDYRGIDVADLIGGFTGEGRFGFEETAYLLLMGALPSREQLDAFCQLLSGCPP